MQRLTRFKLIPALEKNPHLVTFAQRPAGKVVFLAFVALFLFLLGLNDWLLLTTLLGAFTYWPQHRKALLPLATLTYWTLGYADFHWSIIAEVAQESGISSHLLTVQNAALALSTVLAFCTFSIYLVGHSPLAHRIKRPVLALIIFYCAMLCVASYLPLPPTGRFLLWAFLIILGRFFWYLCYSLNECRAKHRPDNLVEVGHYFPFWFPQNIPFAKGSAYLGKIEAKDPVSLAITQLKGLKLMAWAWLLHLFTICFETLFLGHAQTLGDSVQIRQYFGELQILFNGQMYSDILHLPFDLVVASFDNAFALSIAGTPLAWYQNWAALFVGFFYDLLNFAVGGHVVIAVIRICGFNALRNTYSPLTSANIAEFWNRFFYYYKELLVEFFFYPTFFRYFKDRPMLRMYLATLAAAGFGNFLYHFFRDVNFILELGFFQALIAFHTFAFYGFVLGTAIFVSQWRQERRKMRTQSALSRLTSPVAVIVFYCLVSVFIDFRRQGISENFNFFLALFNIQI